MKPFYLIVILISSIGVGFIALNEVAENLRLKREIKSLETVIENQDKILNKCGIY